MHCPSQSYCFQRRQRLSRCSCEPMDCDHRYLHIIHFFYFALVSALQWDCTRAAGHSFSRALIPHRHMTSYDAVDASQELLRRVGLTLSVHSPCAGVTFCGWKDRIYFVSSSDCTCTRFKLRTSLAIEITQHKPNFLRTTLLKNFSHCSTCNEGTIP